MTPHALPLLDDMAHTETVAVLRQLAASERALGILKGTLSRMPSPGILTSTLFIQEARASSEIENIITTQDEAFTSVLDTPLNANAKEVANYNQALHTGYDIVKTERLLTNRHIQRLQAIIKESDAGFRRQLGTVLKDNTGTVIYTPPAPERIGALMANLERFINDRTASPINPLVKMAIIHHQFESIHPFYDGNGRVGRIINILYLYLQHYLDYPALYLSRYLIDHKPEYYQQLQAVRDTSQWEPWILFMLKGVAETAEQTVKVIEKMLALMQQYKQHIRRHHPKVYSQDLINLLFQHPYTKIEFAADALGIHRQTAARYLNDLAHDNALDLSLVKLGKCNYYLNTSLITLFANIRDC